MPVTMIDEPSPFAGEAEKAATARDEAELKRRLARQMAGEDDEDDDSGLPLGPDYKPIGA